MTIYVLLERMVFPCREGLTWLKGGIDVGWVLALERERERERAIDMVESWN
jgi:hypothetical protein